MPISLLVVKLIIDVGDSTVLYLELAEYYYNFEQLDDSKTCTCVLSKKWLPILS